MNIATYIATYLDIPTSIIVNHERGLTSREKHITPNFPEQVEWKMGKRGMAKGGLEAVIENGLGWAHGKTRVHYPDIETNIYYPGM